MTCKSCEEARRKMKEKLQKYLDLLARKDDKKNDDTDIKAQADHSRSG